MWMSAPPLTTVFRRRENDGEPVNDRRLRARIESGQITGSRAARSSNAPMAALTPTRAARAAGLGGRGAPRSESIFSHWSAAALQGIDISGRGRQSTSVSPPPRAGVERQIRRHARDLTGISTNVAGAPRHAPLQTAVDLMASLTFVEGVAVADQALWARRVGGALVERDALIAAAHLRAGRARRVRLEQPTSPRARRRRP